MTTNLKTAWTPSVYIIRQQKFWYRFLLNRRLNFAIKALRPHQPHSLLDIGTGPGDSLTVLTHRLNLQFAVGIDRTEDFLKQKYPTHRGGFVCADIRTLPFRPSSFQAITLIACAKHVFKLSDALKECCHTIRTNGLILIIEPSTFILKLASWIGYFDRHNIPNPLTCREYAHFLHNAGFSSIRYGHFFFGCYQFNLAREGQ